MSGSFFMQFAFIGLLAMIAGCAHEGPVSLAVQNLSKQDLTEVMVICGNDNIGFGYCGDGGYAEWYNPAIHYDRPWTIVWRDAQQKLHTPVVQIDPNRVPKDGTIILQIQSPKVEVIYEKRIVPPEER